MSTNILSFSSWSALKMGNGEPINQTESHAWLKWQDAVNDRQWLISQMEIVSQCPNFPPSTNRNTQALTHTVLFWFPYFVHKIPSSRW